MEVIVTFFQERDRLPMACTRGRPDKRFLERRRGAPSGAIYVRGGGGGIWHRRGALEFRRFDEVRRDLGLELRRGDVLAAAAPRGEHVDDRVGQLVSRTGGNDCGRGGRDAGDARALV